MASSDQCPLLLAGPALIAVSGRSYRLFFRSSDSLLSLSINWRRGMSGAVVWVFIGGLWLVAIAFVAMMH
jgi:hypothetical protein